MLRHWYDIDSDLAVMNEMRRRLEGLFNEYGPRQATTMSSTWPRSNLFDAGNSIIAMLEVPGLKEEDIEIEAHQDVLTISGERKILAPEGYRAHRNERRGQRFSRSFGLPCKVDLEKTKATLKDGILKIQMEKAPESQPKKITVSVD